MSSLGDAEYLVEQGSLYDSACGDIGEWKRFGAEGSIEQAWSMKPSLNTSAANLGYVMSDNSKVIVFMTAIFVLEDGVTHQCAQN